MNSWKYSFEIITKELDLTKKKKQALDELLESRRISEITHDLLEKELTSTIIDLESYQKTLLDKMSARSVELEEQIKSLEMFLANLEIHYVAEEIDEETYQKQESAIMLGLSSTSQELKTLKDSMGSVFGGIAKLQRMKTGEPVEPEFQPKINNSIIEQGEENEPSGDIVNKIVEDTDSLESKEESF